MKKASLSILSLFLTLASCQSKESDQQATAVQEETQTVATAPALGPDVVRMGYTSEETRLLANNDFGAPTIQTIAPLAPVEILDTTDVFFYRVRVAGGGAQGTGYIDKVYLAKDLETATQLRDLSRRK